VRGGINSSQVLSLIYAGLGFSNSLNFSLLTPATFLDLPVELYKNYII